MLKLFFYTLFVFLFLWCTIRLLVGYHQFNLGLRDYNFIRRCSCCYLYACDEVCFVVQKSSQSGLKYHIPNFSLSVKIQHQSVWKIYTMSGSVRETKRCIFINSRGYDQNVLNYKLCRFPFYSIGSHFCLKVPKCIFHSVFSCVTPI